MNENKQSYHHKNLRNELIEKGIELVSIEGVKSFSLRKVAAACGVSHAAPYSHFHNKEELLNTMQEYITEQFCERLLKVIDTYNDSPFLLEKLGIAYLCFFIENPFYFSFLYSQSDMRIDLSKIDCIPDNYMPFEIYKNVVITQLDKAGYPKNKQKNVVIAMWSFIHGITSLATMKNVIYDEDWIKKVIDYMKVFQLTFFSTEGEI